MSLFDIYQKLKNNSNMNEEEEEKIYMYVDSRETDTVSTTQYGSNKKSMCYGFCSNGEQCKNFSSHGGLCPVHKDQKIAHLNI